MNNSELFTRRNLIALIGLAVLLLIIPFGVNLVRQQQILRSRASVDGIVEFKKASGAAITETENSLPLVHERNIQVVLQDPRGPAPSPSASPLPSGQGLQQTLIAADGKSIATRTCHINPDGNRGVNFDQCSNWQTAFSISELPANLKDQGITSWHEVPWKDGSGNDGMQQILVGTDGVAVATRTCKWSPSGNRGIDFGNCSGWQQLSMADQSFIDANKFPDSAKQGITSWHEYYWGSGNQKGLQQILVLKDHKTVLTRTCHAPAAGARADFNQCSGWQQVSFADPAFIAANKIPDSIANQGVTSWHEYFWTNSGNQSALQQVLIGTDGKTIITRGCHSPGPNRGVDFNTCTDWQQLNFSDQAFVDANKLPDFIKNQGITSWFEYKWGDSTAPLSIYDSGLYAPGYNASTSSLFNQIIAIARGFLPKQAQAASECPAPGQVFSCSDIKCADGGTAPGSGCYPDKYASDCQANCVAAGRNGGTPPASSAPASSAPATGGTTDSHGCNVNTQTWSYCDYSCPGTTLKVTGGFCWGKGTNPDGACQSTGNCAAAAAENKEVCSYKLYSCGTANGNPGKQTCTVCTTSGTPPPGITYGETIRGCGECVPASSVGNPPGPTGQGNPAGAGGTPGFSAAPDVAGGAGSSSTPAPSSGTGGRSTLQFVVLADSDNAALLNDDSRKIAWNATGTTMTQAFQLSAERAGTRTVYAKFIYSDGSSEQSHKDIVYRPVLGDPTLTSVTCTSDTVTLQGTNFGDAAGTVGISGVDGTITPASGDWTSTRVVARTTALTGTKTIQLNRPDGKAITGVCTVGQTQVQFTAQLSCKTVNTPVSKATAEILKASDGTSVYKNDQVTFSPDGTAQNILPGANLIAGTSYVLTVKSPFTLTRALQFTAAASGSTTVLSENPLKLPLGDVAPDGTPDGQINNIDQAYARAKWSPINDVTTSADVNIDRKVNSNDWACIRSNFGKANDQVVR